MQYIKFRLRKDGKVVGYEWHHFGGTPQSIWIEHSRDGKEWYEILFSGLAVYILHDSKEQFTGLHDKNGVEIYKNDKVGFWFDKCKIRTGVVKQNISGEWEIGIYGVCEIRDKGGKIEVIKEVNNAKTD